MTAAPRLVCSILFVVISTTAAAQTGSSLYRADKTAVFADSPLQIAATTRLECGARCLTASAVSDCVAFAFSTAGVCSIGYRLNWTAGAGGWLGQTLFVTQAALSAASTTAAGTATTTTTTATTTTPTTTAPRAPYLAFWGGSGQTFDSGRAQCKSMGYADLVSYDNRMGGSTMPNEFNITTDLFKGYTDFSVYLIGAQYNTSESKFQWVSGSGSLVPSMYAWGSAVNTSSRCVTVDRAAPYSMRSVDCATQVEAIICELT